LPALTMSECHSIVASDQHRTFYGSATEAQVVSHFLPPGLVRELADSLKGLNDAETAAIAMAATHHAQGEKTGGVPHGAEGTSPVDAEALALRLEHSRRHRIIISISRSILILTLLGMITMSELQAVGTAIVGSNQHVHS
jgi:hypothetical protein